VLTGWSAYEMAELEDSSRRPPGDETLEEWYRQWKQNSNEERTDAG